MTISFEVVGKPEPRGSKNSFPIRNKAGQLLRIATSDANPKSRPWMNAVAWEAKRAMNEAALIEGPVELLVRFYLVRPKGDFKKDGSLTKNARLFPTVKPDATKLLRAVEDALTGIVWRDDSQVVDQRAQKLYDETTRAVVTIRTLDASDYEDKMMAAEQDELEHKTGAVH